jgi:hypothetical protein
MFRKHRHRKRTLLLVGASFCALVFVWTRFYRVRPLSELSPKLALGQVAGKSMVIDRNYHLGMRAGHKAVILEKPRLIHRIEDVRPGDYLLIGVTSSAGGYVSLAMSNAEEFGGVDPWYAVLSLEVEVYRCVDATTVERVDRGTVGLIVIKQQGHPGWRW